MAISWLLIVVGKAVLSFHSLTAFVLAVVYIRMPTDTRRMITSVLNTVMQRLFTFIFGAASPKELLDNVFGAAKEAIKEMREDYNDAPNREPAWFAQSDEDNKASQETADALLQGASGVVKIATEAISQLPTQLRGGRMPSVVIGEQVKLPQEVAAVPIPSNACPLLNDPAVAASTTDSSTKKEIARKSAEVEDAHRRMVDKLNAHFRNFRASLLQIWRKLQQGLIKCTTYARAAAAGLPTTSIAQKMVFPFRLGCHLISTVISQLFMWCLIMFWRLLTNSLRLVRFSARWMLSRQPVLSLILTVVLYNSWQLHRIIVRSAKSMSLNRMLIMSLLSLMVLKELFARLSLTSSSQRSWLSLKKN